MGNMLFQQPRFPLVTGAVPQSQASLQGVSGFLHPRKDPRGSVTQACSLSSFPISHFSSPNVFCEPPAHHTWTRASSEQAGSGWVWLQPGSQLKQAYPGLHPADEELPECSETQMLAEKLCTNTARMLFYLSWWECT